MSHVIELVYTKDIDAPSAPYLTLQSKYRNIARMNNIKQKAREIRADLLLGLLEKLKGELRKRYGDGYYAVMMEAWDREATQYPPAYGMG